jgi:hypothetical protein
VEKSRFQIQITELNDKLPRVEEKHKESIKHYNDSLAGIQREPDAVKQKMTMATTTSLECNCDGHYEELRAELQFLCSIRIYSAGKGVRKD